MNERSTERAMPAGIPSISEYESLVSSPEFSAIEAFSDAFLSSHAKALLGYGEKWVGDPFHQWSRQWEYLYTLSHIRSHVTQQSSLRILDAGSGVTFFPWLLAEEFPNARVTCCDRDSTFESVFNNINQQRQARVSFTHTNLHELPYENASVDIIFCISVLEHTDNHHQILDEFKRVLKQDGLLIITFDISLNGERDISPEQAVSLLDDINQRFNAEHHPSDLMAALVDSESITTTYFAKDKSSLLPWRQPSYFSFAKRLIRGKGLGWPPLLSFYCLTMRS